MSYRSLSEYFYLREREEERICEKHKVERSELVTAFAAQTLDYREFKEAALEREEELQSKIDDLEEELRQTEIDYENDLENLEEAKNEEISTLQDRLDNLQASYDDLNEYCDGLEQDLA